MQRRIILGIGCVFLLFLSGCVSTSRYIDISNDYQRTHRQLLASKQKIAELNLALEKMQKETDQCRQTMSRLQSENKKNNTEMKLYAQKIESLKQTVEKQAAVISLQNTVIRLFDDSKQTIQNSLKEQMEAQNLKSSDVSQSVK